MKDFYEVSEDQMSITLRCLRDILKRRGWRAQCVKGKTYYFNLTRSDGKELKLYSCTPPTTSYRAGVLADDKLATYEFLKPLGIKQPETEVLATEMEERKRQIAEFLARHPKVVIKPIDGAHGKGVWTDLRTTTEVEEAFQANAGCVNLIQEQLKITGTEVRVICVDYQFVGAFARIPARVTGDGTHTVRELIKIENSTIRTAPYRSNLSFIDEAMAEKYLEAHPIGEQVPAAGEKVQVVAMCNTGRGGTMEDITATFSEEQRRESEKIARELELPVAGIDFLDDYVIEVNSSPALYHPVSGMMATECIEKFVDYLEKL